MYGPGQTNYYQQQKQDLINKNYWSVYNNLLPDEEGPYASCLPPINIGNKDVYALSDIEGQNLEFLKMLKDLGLVNIFYDNNQNAPKGAHECLTKINGELGYKKVYYTFNENACRNFQDVIVLCGDYIAHTDNDNDIKCAEDTVKILKKLNDLLNGNKQVEDKNKRLFLIAGNHDIYTYKGEDRDDVIGLKKEVLKLGLYPQLLLKNEEGKRLLFQHTNFPYREDKNYIVNKQIDPGKAEGLFNNSMSQVELPMFATNGFFSLRYIAKQGDLTPNYYTCATEVDPYSILQREIYSDFGKGYDAKFIGHDAAFYGCSMRPDGKGDVYNVHIANQNDPHFVCWRSNRKTSLPLSNVQQNYNKTGNIYMRKNYYAIQNKEGKKNLYNLLYNKLPKANPPKYY